MQQKMANRMLTERTFSEEGESYAESWSADEQPRHEAPSKATRNKALDELFTHYGKTPGHTVRVMALPRTSLIDSLLASASICQISTANLACVATFLTAMDIARLSSTCSEWQKLAISADTYLTACRCDLLFFAPIYSVQHALAHLRCGIFAIYKPDGSYLIPASLLCVKGTLVTLS